MRAIFLLFGLVVGLVLRGQSSGAAGDSRTSGAAGSGSPDRADISHVRESGYFSEKTDSRTFYFRHLQVENGLSNNAVICSLQDKRGFLWFGTKDGLDRYDGYAFKVFRNDPDDSGSIGSNFIHALYEDPAGPLYVGTEKGLYRFDASTERFSLLPGTGGGPIRDVCQDGRRNLWFISGFTLVKRKAAGGAPEYFPIDRYFEATSLCVTTDGRVWVTSSSGFLYRYDEARDAFTGFDLFDPAVRRSDRWIERAYATGDGTLLIGTAVHGAKRFDTRTAACTDILTYNPDRTAIFVRNFLQTSAEEYWIATESGIYIYNSRTGGATNLRKQFNDPYSMSDNAVYTFCRDREGGIWAGTYFGGVNYYPGQYNSFKKYFPRSGENSLGGYVVREIHQDKAGDLWIGTEDAGLDKLERNGRFVHFRPTGAPGSLSYSNIHGLLVRGDTLWVGTFEHGLDLLNIRTGRVFRHYDEGSGDHALRSSFIYCIYAAQDGRVLLGTTRGAYAYDAAHDYFTRLPGMPLDNWYSSLLDDGQGGIWAGTFGNGVNYFNTQTRKAANYRYDGRDRHSLASDRVNSIFRDREGRLWFATEGGLCKWEPATNNFTRYTTLNGFPSNFMLSLLEDDKGNLWVSTSKGLVCFRPDPEQLTVFTRENGLLNDQFNFSSAFRDPAGRMYFGSVRGMISFHPDEFRPNSFLPPVYITGFQIDNKELAIGRNGSPLTRPIGFTDRITLRHNQSTFSIDFAALGYTAPQTTEYAYKMEGLDEDWIYLKRNRKAYFTGLGPGHYTFKVKASNSSGIWVDRETKLAIDILPPWWASPIAYGGYFLAGLLIALFFIRSYHRRVEEKNRRKIEQLETAKEKEILNAKIEFFTNVAHEIRTPLTLIKGPLEKVMKKAAAVPGIHDSLAIMDRNTNRLIDLTNQLLDFRQTEIRGFSLNFVQANISLLLEENYAGFRALAEQKDLRFDLQLPAQPLLAFVDVDAFNKILANLLGNAVKYAASRAVVSLLSFGEADAAFTIEVSNDGYLIPYEMREKIFEPFFRLKETDKQRGTGIGLALARSLTQLHKGALDLQPAREGMNIFRLTMPVHQDKEFNLYEPSYTLSG
jgi:signal transduction histidine kinase/ligand-binding sensor domain-containing protein